MSGIPKCYNDTVLRCRPCAKIIRTCAALDKHMAEKHGKKVHETFLHITVDPEAWEDA